MAEKQGVHPDPAFAARVARLVYVERLPRDGVAAAEGCSEATLNRALRYAKEHGIVRYVVDEVPIGTKDSGLEYELCTRFHLTHAIVVDLPSSAAYEPRADDHLHGALGKALAPYIRLIVRPGDHVVTTGGRGVYCAAKALAERPVERKDVRVSTVPERPGAAFHDLAGPLAAPGVEARDTAFYLAKGLGQSPQAVKALAQPAAGDVLLCGIGTGGVFENADGGVTIVELAQIPVVIAVAGGVRKMAAVRAALALRRPSGEPFITVLSTDAATARHLIDAGPAAAVRIRPAATVKMQVAPL